MINPMIAMTTSISTRVKPASARRSARRPLDIAKRLIALSHLRDRQIAHRRSARGCHAQDFGRRGHPDPAFFDGIVQHRRHAGMNGGAVNDRCVRSGAVRASADETALPNALAPQPSRPPLPETFHGLASTSTCPALLRGFTYLPV
jgi:hypothetical protein